MLWTTALLLGTAREMLGTVCGWPELLLDRLIGQVHRELDSSAPMSRPNVGPYGLVPQVRTAARQAWERVVG
ncbi:MAG TPA: hypothetical protein VGR26_01665, partial [Acidimicrobiales bacterium]|nr:hypothetical protein [Acidimicrobiales bacterium]